MGLINLLSLSSGTSFPGELLTRGGGVGGCMQLLYMQPSCYPSLTTCTSSLGQLLTLAATLLP